MKKNMNFMMRRNGFRVLASVTVSLVSGALFADEATRPAQPNLLLILADDLGWQDIKVYDEMETEVVNGFGGTSVFETPTMDQLASEGTLFTHAYSPSPVCSPSRVAILSGKHPARTDVTSVAGGKVLRLSSGTAKNLAPHWRSTMKDEEITIAELLDEAGYFTGMFGKWHIEGSPDTPGPAEQGFKRTFQDRGMNKSVGDRLTGFATNDEDDLYRLDENGYARDSVTEAALEFLTDATSQGDPFFCYYSTWLVHSPWQMRTESLLQKYAEKMGYDYPLDGSELFEEGQKNPYYAAMVESLDYYISRLIKYLKETDDPRWPGHKLIENTYIVLTSDNGGMEVGDDNGQVTDNFPLDKGKIWIKEGGTRVPFIVRGPGIAADTVSEAVVNGLDLYPTFLALAGEDIPSERLDGYDLSSLWLNDIQDSDRIRSEAGEVRESMFWHFPHSGRVATTMVKDGWKLYKNYDHWWAQDGDNNLLYQQYSLYQLYDAQGDAVDLGEMNDLIDSHGSIAAPMIEEMEAWIAETDARPQYKNSNRPDVFPLADQSLRALASGNDDTVAWVSWNTDRAKLKYLDLMFTKMPTPETKEEWFKVKVPFEHAKGWAEVEIPEGATHFYFVLVDENDFFTESAGLTGLSGTGSQMVPAWTFEPTGTATITNVGTTYPSGDVLLGNSLNEVAPSAIRDDGTNLQVTGQTFTIDEPTKISAITLQAYTIANVGSTDSAEYLLWIGRYADGAPSTQAFRTQVYQTIDMRGVSLVTDNFYTIDFDDAILLPGTYAFQLRWKERAGGNNSYWARANGAGEYAGGDRIHILTSSGAEMNFPFSATPGTGTDLVFALHGSTDHFGGWVAENALDRVPKDPYSNGVENGVTKNSVFYGKSSSSAWAVQDGVLENESASNNNVGEGVIGKCIDLTKLAESSDQQLKLSFEYSLNDPAEKLYVHLWGLVDNEPGVGNPGIMNVGAQNGSVWVNASGMDVYNLGKADGAFTGSRGSAGDAAAILTGSTGTQQFTTTFDLSEFTTAPNKVTGYDYVVLGFAREVGGAADPAVTITKIKLETVGGKVLHEFPMTPADTTGLLADPDGDGRSNLHEFSFGGDPNRSQDSAEKTRVVFSNDGVELRYQRRRDHANQGVNYRVQSSTTLKSDSWADVVVQDDGQCTLDDDFETVVHQLDDEGAEREFLRVVVKQN